MSLVSLCPECGGLSPSVGSDELGTVYACEAVDDVCVVSDHWRDDVRTYRDSYHRALQVVDEGWRPWLLVVLAVYSVVLLLVWRS